MKHIKKYIVFENKYTNLDIDPQEFNLDFVITKIKEKFSEEEVISEFDEEILNWVDNDWSDDYESEYDWYVDHNNGEAQDVVIDNMIQWIISQYNLIIDVEQKIELINAIKNEYTTLNYV